MENQELQAAPAVMASITTIAAKNSGLADRAIEQIEAKLQAAPTDLGGLEVLTGDSFDSELADLQSKATTAVQWCKTNRMPITKEFDRIRAIFTEAEKNIENSAYTLKQWRESWAKEKNERRKEAERKQAEALALKNAENEYRAIVGGLLASARREHGKHVISHITKTFYLYKIDTIDSFEKDVMSQIVANIRKLFTIPVPPEAPSILDANLVASIKKEAYDYEITDKMGEVIEEAENLVRDLAIRIPARKLELERATDAELEAEARAQEERLALAAAQKEAEEQAAAAAAAEMEKLNAAMEVAEMAPAVQQSKGTSKKSKYEATTHKAFIAIITHWVTNHMANFTIEELNKKLSFMVTAANKDLNEGVKIEADGLNIVDDFTVRGGRKK